MATIAESGRFYSDSTSAIMQVPCRTVTQVFRETAIKKRRPEENFFGLYNFLKVGPRGKAKMVGIGKFIGGWKCGDTVCKWDPSGKLYTSSTELETKSKYFQTEFCPDAITECLYAIRGVGNREKDLLATEQGRALWTTFLDRIILEMGNKYTDIIDFGKFHLFEKLNKPECTDNEEFEGFKSNLDTCVGHLETIYRASQSGGKCSKNLWRPFFDATNTDGCEFKGDVKELFEFLLKNSSSKLKIIARSTSRADKPVFRVTRAVFDAYLEQLAAESQNGCVPNDLRYCIQGDDEFGSSWVDGISFYKSIPVVAMDDWICADDTLGICSFYADLVARNTLVIANDSDQVANDGFGLEACWDLKPPANGKAYIQSQMSSGFGIVETDMLTTTNYFYNEVSEDEK